MHRLTIKSISMHANEIELISLGNERIFGFENQMSGCKIET